jgi:hypothetical protein
VTIRDPLRNKARDPTISAERLVNIHVEAQSGSGYRWQRVWRAQRSCSTVRSGEPSYFQVAGSFLEPGQVPALSQVSERTTLFSTFPDTFLDVLFLFIQSQPLSAGRVLACELPELFLYSFSSITPILQGG